MSLYVVTVQGGGDVHFFSRQELKVQRELKKYFFVGFEEGEKNYLIRPNFFSFISQEWRIFFLPPSTKKFFKKIFPRFRGRKEKNNFITIRFFSCFFL